jgi:hypothetical protein
MLRVASGDRLVGYTVGCTGLGTTQQFGMHGLLPVPWTPR